MKIENLGGNIFSGILKEKTVKTESKDDFGSMIGGFIKDVNKLQSDSTDMTDKFINGENVELHEVMIAGEKAKTSLELLMEIRNKTLDMYKELTRM